jgi:carbonic anhydrase
MSDSNTPRHDRRTFLLNAAAGVAGGSLAAQGLGKAEAAAPMTPGAQHLQALMAGNARFVAGTPHCEPATTRRVELASGQAPFAAVLACSDSRVPVEAIFDHGPGDIFVVRVAGNFINADNLGSLEYGVAVLKASIVMVLGHSNCGAIKAATEAAKGESFPGNIQELATALLPAAKATKGAPGDWVANATRENVRLNLRALTDLSSILTDAIRNGRLWTVGAVYDLHTGKVSEIT